MEIKKINHVAIVVAELQESIPLWKDIFGLSLEHEEDVPSQKARIATFSIGESKLELVQPDGEESGLTKFLKEHGAGIHHICLEVNNIETALSELKTKGVKLINETPQVLDGRKLAFIHPKATGGVLIELYELM